MVWNHLSYSIEGNSGRRNRLVGDTAVFNLTGVVVVEVQYSESPSSRCIVRFFLFYTYMDIQIWTDGSANNMTKNRGGYGIVFLNGELKTFCGGSYFNTTSARMEILAVVRAMMKCQKGDKVTIHCDNEYVVNALEKNYLWNWQKNNFRKKANVDLWRLFLDEYTRLEGKVTLKWVRGHDGSEMNELADALARQGADSMIEIQDMKHMR